MKQWLVSLVLFCCSTPVFAQTVCRVEPLHDDCPPAAVKHPPVSPLDQAYMEAAFRASFVGIFGREPSMMDGAGKEDGCYYVRASNHYGMAGDGQCHAGWSGYWESWLQNGRGDLALVQTPARFLPGATPLPIPTPVPVPSPTPTDLRPLADQLRNTYLALIEQAQANKDAILAAVAGTSAKVDALRADLQSRWEALLKSPYFQVIAGAIVTWATTYRLMK